MSDNRNLRAQQALWSGLRRFTERHEQGLTQIVHDEVEFAAAASVVFQDDGEWCWAVSLSSGEQYGGVEATEGAAKAAANAKICP